MTYYQDCVLAYLDILGWSELTRESQSCPEIIAELDAAIRTSVEGWEGRTPLHMIQFAQFSDHLCISCPTSVGYSVTPVLHWVGAIALRLVKMGYATRGAIVAGPLVHTGNRIFGPALVEAHEIESKVAKYPRLVLSDRAVELVATEPPPVRPVRRKDVDGLTFVDIFAVVESVEEIEKIRAALARRPHREALDVRSKRGWLLEQLRQREINIRSTPCSTAL